MHRRVQPQPLAELAGDAQRDLLRSARKPVLLGAAAGVEHPVHAAGGLDVAHRVQHRHLVRLTSPCHAAHERHQGAHRRRRTDRSQPFLDRHGIKWALRRPRLVKRNSTTQAAEMPADTGEVEQLADRQLGCRAPIGADAAAPSDQVVAVVVGRDGMDAQVGGQLEYFVLRRADERGAEVDGHAGEGGRARPAADTVSALEHDDVVAELDQFTGRGQSGKSGADDHGVRIRVSHGH